jgi:hypothetical protein
MAHGIRQIAMKEFQICLIAAKKRINKTVGELG